MSIVDTELVSYKEKLTQPVSTAIWLQSKRLNSEYLENALSVARIGQPSIVELVNTLGPEELPERVSAIQAIGMSTPPRLNSRDLYIFAFPDGSWFSHDIKTNHLTYTGSELNWNVFLSSLVPSAVAQ